MIKSNAQAAAETAAEYSVYTYRSYSGGPYGDGSADWERKITTKNKLRALAKAKKLYASNDYERVEIKKKMLTSASIYPFDTIMKVYSRPNKNLKPSRSLILICGIALGVVISGLCAYLTLAVLH